MLKRKLIWVSILLLLGWLSHSVYSTQLSSFHITGLLSKPLLGETAQDGMMAADEALQNAYGSMFLLSDRPSPQDHLKEEQINVLKDKVVINIRDAEWARFTDTNSMDPVIDEGANALEIRPQSPDEIQVGDIISYSSPEGVIIHRVVELGNDGEWYARLKGDNAELEDPGKVRFNQVERIVVGILY